MRESPEERRYGGRGRQADTVSSRGPWASLPPRRTATAIGLGRVPGTRTEVIRLARRRSRRPTPSQRSRFLRSPKRSSSFSPRCLFARDFVLRARAARALGTRSLRRLETSTLLLSTITATQAQRSKPTKSTYTWGKAGTLRTWSSTNGGRGRGVVQSPYPVLLATYPPSLPRSHPLSPAPLPRSLVCLLGTCKQVALMLELDARRRRRHLTRSLIHCVRPSASALGASVRPSALNSTHSIPRSLARFRSSCRRRRRRPDDADAPRPWQSRNCGARRRRRPREGLRAGKEGEEEGEGGRERDAEAGRWRTTTQGTQGARRK